MINEILWKKLEKFEVIDKDDHYSFIERLSVQNNWSHDFSISVYREYLKFIYLHCVSNSPVTPSDEVDQVWHLHLVYTESYWNDLCDSCLGKNIHHVPARGGNNENKKFQQYYQQTLNLYKKEFGIVTDSKIWPISEHRFQSYSGFKRINTNSNVVIKYTTIKKSVIIASLSFLLAACTLDEINPNVMIFGGIFLVIIVLILFKKGGGGGSGCSSGDGGGCSGGD